jgi:hypothetical protein
MRSDDFGYYESVVETLRRGAPASSEWLEPFNLVLPAVSAMCWQATGSFYMATLGLTAALAVLNVALLRAWLRPALNGGIGGELAFLALALAPIWLNKSVEFTGVPLGVALTLGVVLAWRARRWAIFFTLLGLAVLNRQSAVCLLLLPGMALFEARRRDERAPWVVFGCAAITALAAVLVFLVPPTFARAIAAERGGSDAGTLLAQGLLGLGLCGGMAATAALLCGRAASLPRATRAVAALGWLAGGAVVLAVFGVELKCEAPQMQRFAPLFVLTAFILAACVPDALLRIPRGALVAVVVFVALVSWRGVWWDYYLLEPAVLLAWPDDGESNGSIRPPSYEARLISTALTALLSLWAVFGVWALNRQLRWAEGACVAYEVAERTGAVAVTQASHAPFGYLGWKLFPALLVRPHGVDTRLTDFLKFVQADRTIYRQGRIEMLPPSEPARSLHPSRVRWDVPAEHRARPLPLRDAEWAELIRSQ